MSQFRGAWSFVWGDLTLKSPPTWRRDWL